MTIVLPGPLPSLAAGHIATADDMNAMVGVVNFLANRPICQVSATVGGRAVSATPNTTSVQWDIANIDNSGMYSSSSPSQLTIQVAGWYKVRYSVVVTAASAGVYNGYLTQGGGGGGGNYLGSYADYTSSLPACALGASGTWPFYLAAGNTLTLWVNSNATGSTTSITPCGSNMSLEFVSE